MASTVGLVAAATKCPHPVASSVAATVAAVMAVVAMLVAVLRVGSLLNHQQCKRYPLRGCATLRGDRQRPDKRRLLGLGQEGRGRRAGGAGRAGVGQIVEHIALLLA